MGKVVTNPSPSYPKETLHARFATDVIFNVFGTARHGRDKNLEAADTVSQSTNIELPNPRETNALQG